MTIKVRLAQQEHIWGERNVYYLLLSLYQLFRTGKLLLARWLSALLSPLLQLLVTSISLLTLLFSM